MSTIVPKIAALDGRVLTIDNAKTIASPTKKPRKMRKKIAAGNWKMNKTLPEAVSLASSLSTVAIPENTQVILGVPHVFLSEVRHAVEGSAIELAAQNCHQEDSGAYTGETSPVMLQSLGIPYVILGHSERRQYFQESDELLAAKTDAALKHGLKVIFCCGESLSVRESGGQNEFVSRQLRLGLFHLDAAALKQIIIAYEPIWAIGTGVTASPEQAQEMHQQIRRLISEQYGAEAAANMHILYGGSVKPDNAATLFGQPDVDGGLVGGASLKADDFAAIMQA